MAAGTDLSRSYQILPAICICRIYNNIKKCKKKMQPKNNRLIAGEAVDSEGI
jgi:hypothetical protein